METSLDRNIIFCGCSTSKNIESSTGFVSALTLDNSVRLMSKIILENKINGEQRNLSMGVSSISRIVGTNVLVTGVNCGICIVEWSGSHFEILNRVSNLHTCNFIIDYRVDH